jgi:hypothetical protein
MFKAATFAISGFLVGVLLGCSSDPTKGGEPPRAPPGMADPAPEPTQSAEPPPPAATGPEPYAPPANGCAAVTPRRARRIAISEYEQLVSSLVRKPVPVANLFAADPLENGYDNQADVLTVSGGNLETFVQAAETASLALDPPSCAGAERSCARVFAEEFGARAFGRALDADELQRLLDVYDAGAVEDYAAGVRLLTQAVLSSPHVLYRLELGAAEAEGEVVALTPAEVANNLAFALTGSRPEVALIEEAASDPDFLDRESLRDDAEQLVQTELGRAHIERFLRNWLGVPDVRNVYKVSALFPGFTDAVKNALDDEFSAFIQDVLGGEGDGTLESLLGSTRAFMSEETLAAVYAADFDAGNEPSGRGLFAVEFNPKLRRGVLSLGAWLSAHSPVHRSSPVDRGIAIRTRFFCESLPPPPPGALAMAPNGDPQIDVITTRQKFEQHTTDPSCSSCHRYVDPIGFGLEMMDGIGRYRTTESGQPVDSTGELKDTDVDGPFEGPADLAERLLESRQVRDCFVRQMFRFIEGRSETRDDECELAPIQERFAEDNQTISDLAIEIAIRPGALARRVE